MTVLLNPVFNWSKSLLSFSADKVTTRTYNLQSVILNATPVGAAIAGLYPCAAVVVISAKTQFLDQFKVKGTSQLINGISSISQKLLRYFNGTENLARYVFPSLAVFPVILVLYLKDSEFAIGSVEVSL